MAITQVITDLPDPPQRSAPDDFADNADAFLDALPDLGDEINTWAGQANALATTLNGYTV
jgi:hypothetical protein